MARTDINNIVQDLQSDDGSVLWSLVLGEQIEYPVTLNFITNAYYYTYEAVVVEAANIEGSESIPNTTAEDPIMSTLVVRVPPEKGVWNPATAYSREDVVSYSGLYYKLKTAVGRISSTTPDVDPYWEVYVPNKVYVQFPSGLGVAWGVKPTANVPVYGFFELRVTEPEGGIYQRTWKPVRGVIELSFSPTEML